MYWPHGLGNGPHGLGNGPHGLGNGPHGLGIAIYCYLYHGEVRLGHSEGLASWTDV